LSACRWPAEAVCKAEVEEAPVSRERLKGITRLW